MHPVTCRACGDRVLVTKYSAIHTSVQWTAPSGCLEVRTDTMSEGVPLVITCLAMRESIDVAVREGLIEVPR